MTKLKKKYFMKAEDRVCVKQKLKELIQFLNKNHQLLLLVPLAVITLAIIKGLASYGESIYMEYSAERIISEISTF